MKRAIILGIFVLFGLTATGAQAGGCCQQQQYYNWAQVQRQNQAARLRGIQGQQRVCRNIKSSGRSILWTGC